MTPAATPAEAAAAVRAARPLGISCHRTARCPHVHLDLRPMHAIRFYQPGDLTIGADAGCTAAALNAVLAERGQFVPLDIENAGTTTLGAVLARHLSGPLRHRFGSVRDFTIGLEMIAADGSLVHCGGRVVKNVAGYDWMKPVIGSRGSLGIITGVNFKVFPLPTSIESAHFAALTWPQVESLRTALLHSHLRLLAAELDAHSGARSVAVTYHGSAAVRARYRKDLASFGLPVTFAESPLPPPTPAINLSLPPAEAIAALSALSPEAHIRGRLSLGLFAVTPQPATSSQFPATSQLLKSALDPAGIFHGECCA